MKSMEIIEGALDTVVFFIFLLTVRRIQMFLALNLPYSKGNNPSKFQLAEVRRFGEVREQTNRQTDSLTDWRFYSDIDVNTYVALHNVK